ncbi:unnamed protein product [Closterium sp. NIES-65]|nr:unnamed protein product [Closterium sp. NIES-65]
MVTLKLTSSAFDYQDGEYLVNKDLPTPQRGTHRHLKELPSALQYMGYIFCGGLHLTGPFFELRPYLDWAKNRGVWSHDARKAPFAIPLLVALAWATAAGFIHLVLKPQLNLPLVTDPKRFYAIPYLHRWGHVIISTYAVRCKIYYVWTVAEASMIASGLGFSGAAGNAAKIVKLAAKSPLRKNGVVTSANDENEAPEIGSKKVFSSKDLVVPATNGFLTACEETKDDIALAKMNGVVTEQAKVADVAEPRLVASWERAKNINIAGVELAKAFNAYAKNWNVSVGLWLRTYIYERTIPAGQKPGVLSLLLTVGVSAIWHGIYIGDFMFAFSGAFLIMGSRACHHATNLPSPTLSHSLPSSLTPFLSHPSPSPSLSPIAPSGMAVIYRYQRTIPESQWLWATLVQALHCLYSFAGLNYIAMGFIVLTAEDTITVYRGLNFVGNLLPVLVLGGNWALRRLHALLSPPAVAGVSSGAVSSKRIAAELEAKQPEQQQVVQPVLVHTKVE